MATSVNGCLSREDAQRVEVTEERRFHRDMSRLLFGVTIAWIAVLSYVVGAVVM